MGINGVSESLITFPRDVRTRIKKISFSANSDDAVRELIRRGAALNITFVSAEEIVRDRQLPAGANVLSRDMYTR